MKNLIRITLAETELEIGLIYPDTAKAFQRFVSTDKMPPIHSVVCIQDSDIDDWMIAGNSLFDVHAEYSSLCISISEELLKSNKFVMHAVAFKWNDYAWLLTAPSGTGKSTQYLNLSVLYPDEIQMISGDRPILEIKENGAIFVHPSPWNGKENWWGVESAPLAGIFFLKQGKENDMACLSKEDAVTLAYSAVFQSYNSKEIIQKVAYATTQLLRKSACWLLTNRGDLSSSELIYQTMKKWSSKA